MRGEVTWLRSKAATGAVAVRVSTPKASAHDAFCHESESGTMAGMSRLATKAGSRTATWVGLWFMV